MTTVTKREAVHALVDRYPDEELDAIAEMLSRRRTADGTDVSTGAILARHGETPMSADNFKRYFGDLPIDGEG